MKDTGISWCDHTINFWYGCKKIDTGCKNCYMYRDRKRYGQDGNDIIKRDYATIISEIKKFKTGDTIFVSSWTDFFLTIVPDEWRDEAIAIMNTFPQFNWLILTKRIDYAQKYFTENLEYTTNPACESKEFDYHKLLFKHSKNIWVGVSVSTQADADRLIPKLLNFDCRNKFVSIEPMLERIYISKWKLDWVICGSESGTEMRYCDTEWIEDIINQCKLLNTPIFVKQIHIENDLVISNKDKLFFLQKDFNKFTDELKYQEFPNFYNSKLHEMFKK